MKNMKNHYLPKLFVAAILFIGVISNANATVRTSVGSGNWTTASTWDCNCIPAPGDSVIIDNANSVTVDADSSCIYVRLNAPSGFTSTALAVGIGVTFTVNGNIDLNDGPSTTTIFGFTGAGTANVTGNITMIGSTTGRSKIDMGPGASVLNIGGDIIQNTTGEVVSGSNGSTVNFNGSGAQTLTIGTGMIFENITFNNSGSGVTLGTVLTASNVTGNINIQSGTFDNGGFAVAGSSNNFQISAAGTYNLSGTSTWPTGFTDLIAIGSLVEYTGGSQLVAAPGNSQAYSNLIFSGGSTKTLVANIDVDGALTIVGLTTLDADVANNFNINAAGNWTNNGTFNGRAATVLFDGSTTVGGSATTTFNTVSIVNTFTLTGDPGTMNISGNWINNGTFADNGGTVDFTVSSAMSGSATTSFNNLTISGTLTGPAAGTINVLGNWNNTGTYAHNAGTVDFLGVAAKGITSDAGETFNKLTISGSGTVSLFDNVVVSNILTMNGGDIATGTDTLTLGTGLGNEGTLSHTGGSVIGRHQRWINNTTSYLFPVGTASNVNSATITFSALTGGTITAEFTGTDPGNNGLPIEDAVGDTVYDAFDDGFWDLSVGDGLVATTYNLDLDATGFVEHTVHADSTHMLKRGISVDPWVFDGTHAAAVPPLVKRTGLSGLSQFGCANICPSPSTIIVGPDSVCTSDRDTFSVVTAASSYSWSVTGGTIFNNLGDSIVVDWDAPPGAPNMSVSVTETNICGVSGVMTTLNINVHTFPTSSITGDAAPFISTSDIYTVLNNNGYSYAYSLTDGLGSLSGCCDDSTVSITWGSTAGNDTLVLIATAGSCASVSDSLPIVLNSTFVSATSGDWNNVNTWVGPPLAPPTSADSVTILSSHTVTVTATSDVCSDLALTAGGSNALLVINTASILTIGGDVTLVGAGGASTANITVNGTGTLTIGGDLNFNESSAASGASIFMNDGGSSTLNLGGDFNLNTLGTFSSSANTLNMNGTIAQTLNIGSSIVLNHINFSNSGPGVTLGGIITDGNVIGDIIVVSGVFDNGGFAMAESSGDKLEVTDGATFRVTTTDYPLGFNDVLGATSIVEYNSNSAQTVDGSMTYGHLSLVASSTSTKTLGGSNIDVDGDLSIGINTILDAGSGPFNINLAGNWTNDGGFTHNNNLVTFDGTTAIGGTAATTFNDMTVNGSGVSLFIGTIVGGTLTMTLGDINTGSDTLTLGTSTSNEGSLSHSAGIIIGLFQRWANTTSSDFLFPIGSFGTLNPAVINFTSLTGGTVTAGFSALDPGNAGLPIEDSPGDTVYDAFNDGFWELTAGNGLSATTYGLGLVGTGFIEYNIHTDSTHIIKRASGGDPWTFDGTHIPANPDTVFRTGLSGLGQFGIGNICGVPTSSIVGPNSACTAERDTFSVATATSSYVWSVFGGTIFNDLGDSIVVDWSSSGTASATVKVVETAQCGAVGDTATINVVVSPLPTSPITGEANPITGSTKVYTVLNNTGYSYAWTLYPATNLGSITDSCCDSTISITWGGTPGNDTIRVIVTSGSCPNDTATLPVVLGGTITSTTSGFWDVGSTWVGGSVPSSADSVIIAATHTVTVRTATDSCSSVSLNSALSFNDSKITVNTSSALTVGKNIHLNGDGTAKSQITVNGTGVLNVVGNINMNESSNEFAAALFMNDGGASTLNLGGNMVLNTVGRFEGGSGNTLNLNGTSAQMLNATTNFTFNHITCNNPAGVTLGGKVTTTGDVTITSGTLNTGGFTLNCGGDFTNGGTFTQGTDTLGITGSSAQVIGGSGLNTFTNLTINNSSGGVSLAQGIDISSTGTLSLNGGTLSLGGQILTLRSDASGTARIGEVTGGGDISGSFTMERFISGADDWRIMGSPVSGATLAQWNTQIPMSGFTGSNAPGSSFMSVYTYTESTTGGQDSGFVGATNTSNTLGLMQGFYLWVGEAPGAGITKTVSLTGALVKGDQPYSASYTDDPLVGDTADGWHMVANPYPSDILWDSVTLSANMTPFAYVLDPAAKDYKAAYEQGVGPNDKIPSMQGFFIKSTSGGGTATFKERHKVTDGNNYEKMVGNSEPTLVLEFSAGTRVENTSIRFRQAASEAYDPMHDAFNIFSTDWQESNFSSETTDGVELQLNSLPELNQDYSVPLRVEWAYPSFQSGAIVNCTIDAIDFSDLPSSTCLVLEDLDSAIFTDLRVSSYNFDIVNSTTSTRFMLHIGVPMTKAVNNVMCNGANDGQAIVGGTGSAPWNYLWQNSNGDTVRNVMNLSSADTASGLGPDTYTVIVTNSGGYCTTAMDTVVISEPTALASSIAQSQNPTCFGDSDGSIDLMMSGGTEPYSYSWSNGATTEDLNNVASGVYDVNITDANNCNQSENATLTDPVQVMAGFATDIDTTYLTSGGTIQFYNSSTNAVSYTWDFGDGDSATANDVFHSYLTVGTYTVVLLAYDVNGCSSTSSYIINVMDSPDAINEISAFEDMINIVQADGNIYIDFSFDEEIAVKISVYNLIGQEVINHNEVKVKEERIRVNLTNESLGIYFVKVESKNESLTEKIVY